MRNGYYASDHEWWKTAVLLGILLLVGGSYAFQRYLDYKLDVAQSEWSTEIEQARSQAQAAQLRLAALKTAESARHDDRKPKDFELIRAEAHLSHAQYQELLAQATREREQDRIEREREQQAAANGSRGQIAALERALAIPIQRH